MKLALQSDALVTIEPRSLSWLMPLFLSISLSLSPFSLALCVLLFTCLPAASPLLGSRVPKCVCVSRPCLKLIKCFFRFGLSLFILLLAIYMEGASSSGQIIVPALSVQIPKDASGTSLSTATTLKVRSLAAGQVDRIVSAALPDGMLLSKDARTAL
ncbi:hypothetical protein TraAM80_04904 [Trypanosoma rangeli]|uniref:Uncharacterized protein n=1 Tax=Trypanosoma rangeli TaxID=5698 RepID=A0A3R7KMR1_TRYRA|nr:uncharacterized protein TraAM80_04904 [Trypanosoma rangeli]RNF04779.1 hypothetical protein TraAM80_04904 [Trypanosoma rangeli]|eukprot:RNF04779.1 hypothetical protein TraAM80_04904 [Trypanosoma rangeli]